MATRKIVAVGGGSFTWGPVIISSVVGTPHLGGCHVVLHDINADALGLMSRLARKYQETFGSEVTFEATTDQAAALDGADYVIVTIAVGGLAAMRRDLEIPEKYGVFHTVGDTAGPAGLARALRNIPVFLRLARAMEERCPRAYMLNCSNPLSALTRVVTKETGIRAVGVCHGVRNVVKDYARFFGVPFEECAYVNTGIDHCSWLTDFAIGGRAALEILGEMGIGEWLAKPPAEASEDPRFAALARLRCGIQLGRQLGALPAIGDRHLMEFLPTYIRSPENLARFGLTRTSADEREAAYAKSRDRVERLIAGEEELHLSTGSDDIGGWIAALDGGPAVEDNLNAPNCGQIPQLPAEAIVETRGILDATGLHPFVSPLPPQLEAIVRPHVLREELTVEAAVEGNLDKALAVMATDPVLPSPDLARPLLEELLIANQDWLPWIKG